MNSLNILVQGFPRQETMTDPIVPKIVAVRSIGFAILLPGSRVAWITDGKTYRQR
jgi:hypothetical protein